MEKTVYKNAYVWGYGPGYTVDVRDGVVERVAPTNPKEEGIDLTGKTISPRFVDSHMHLDKAMVPLNGEPRGLLAAIQDFTQYLRSVPAEQLAQDMTHRSRQVIKMALRAGTGCIKTNLMLGGEFGWAAMESFLQLKKEYQGVLQLLNAVPIEDGEEAEFERRAAAGQIDFIAGYPTLSPDYKRDIDRIFDMALRYNLPVDLHVDESDAPNIDCFLYLLQKTIDTGMQGRVTCGHVTALGAVGLPEDTARCAIDLAARAGVYVTTLTSCNLYLMGDNRRGPTLVRQLLQAGVPVAVASDNVRDPFRPYGNANLLQEALLTAQVHKLAGEKQLNQVFGMITNTPAKNCLLPEYGVAVGQPANFVVLNAATPAQAVLQGGGALFCQVGTKSWQINV